MGGFCCFLLNFSSSLVSWRCQSLREKSPHLEFSGPYFPAFGLNAEIYRVNLRIQSKCGKKRTKKPPNKDTFVQWVWPITHHSLTFFFLLFLLFYIFYFPPALDFRSSRSQIVFKIGVLKNFAVFTGTHLCWILFLIKFQAWRYFPLNIAKFVKTVFLQNTSCGCFWHFPLTSHDLQIIWTFYFDYFWVRNQLPSFPRLLTFLRACSYLLCSLLFKAQEHWLCIKYFGWLN